MQTSLPHVFSAGDAVRGPATVIHAIADGHRAAEAIDRFAQGLPVQPPLAAVEEAGFFGSLWDSMELWIDGFYEDDEDGSEPE